MMQKDDGGRTEDGGRVEVWTFVVRGSRVVSGESEKSEKVVARGPRE